MSGLRQVLLGLLAVIVIGLIVIGAFTLSFRERSQGTVATPSQALQTTPSVSQEKTQKPTASPTLVPLSSDDFPTSDESGKPTKEVIPSQTPAESTPETSEEVQYQSMLPGAFKEIPHQASIIIIQEEAEPTVEITEPPMSETTEEPPYQASVIVIQEEAEPTVAATEQAVTETKSEACSKPRGWVAYRVRHGDTLSRLSRITGVSVSRIKKVNCLKSNKIKPGKMIYIPRVPYALIVWHPAPYPMQPPLYYNPPRKPQSAEQIRPVVIVTMPP